MKKLVSLLLAVALAASLCVPTFAFTDVPAQSALAGEVQKAVDYGLMNGYDSTRFGYSDSMTRAQFVTVLVRMFGWSTSGSASGNFTDVPENGGYTAYIQTAASHDVMDTGGAFRPNDAITRAEMSEMLVRALGLKSAAELVRKTGVSLPFTDVSGASAPYIFIAYSIGMTNGLTATTFGPDRTATRAQAAAMLVRIYEKLQQKTDFVHGFYAISSYSQLSLAQSMDAVSVGWSRMTWDGKTALLSTTSANGNEFCIPSGYEEVTSALEARGVDLNLNVFMDASGNVAALLASESGRKEAVAQIINELTVTYKTIGKNPYSGVTIDFEGLRSASKADFTAFLQELSQQLDAISGGSLSLYVCVSPVLATGSYYDGYDYQAIGQLADKVILMAYDYDARNLSGYEGTEYYKTAALTPIDQVYWSLWNIVEQISDTSKIVLGFSRKNMAWEIDASGKLVSGTPVSVSNEVLEKRLAQSDTVRGWSDTYQCSYATYTTEDGSRYFVWYDDTETVQCRLNLAKLLGGHRRVPVAPGLHSCGTGWMDKSDEIKQ